jgi:ABC-type phosphate transport system substrate-binding protein
VHSQMSARRRIRRLILLLGLIATSAAAQDVVFVVNKDLQISGIRLSDVHAIFTGEKSRFSNGEHAVPVILKGGPAHEVFVKNYCDETPGEFRAQWNKAVFTGQGVMPRTFESEAALVDYVAITPGAIGYVSRVSGNDNVKTIAIVK